jgi:hypothetical protein
VTRPAGALPAAGGPTVAALAAGSGITFGSYRTVRELGRGGMGVVYEAEDIHSGRRVALKVLASPLEDDRARQRFVREGRLAASINHPHVVFVFAAEESDGHPVIAMELMAGTLADRLKREGRLASTVAVDAVLQIISGLQAAADAAILHRDIKPSNCFVDAHGVIKVGDFGIARSQRPSEETQLATGGVISGTPAYASPEQLRGAAVDVRADIYSVGATLYELVTGRRPFEGSDLMELLMRVANDPPAPPHVVNPDVPRGLGAVILRCLAKARERRFADYDALAVALEPYSSVGATPATVGRRFVAGLVDNWLAGLPVTFVAMTNGIAVTNVWWHVATLVYMLVYFVAAERVWAATPGKALFGLRLAPVRGEPPGIVRLAARAALYLMAFAVNSMVMLAFLDPPQFVPESAATAFLLQVPQWVILAMLFSTARRANGYAGVHDLATRMRVVERRRRPVRTSTPAIGADAQEPPTGERLGAFVLLEGRIAGLGEEWRRGFDDRLQRPVWIRLSAIGTPPVRGERQTLSRPARLRWLGGRRDHNDSWDAFEAAAGMPLAEACRRPCAWADVRWWLLDLTKECAAATAEDRAPRRIDHVWVLPGGGAKLIDDPIGDGSGTSQPSETASDSAFLAQIALLAQSGTGGDLKASGAPCLWPLGARRLVDRLRTNGNGDLGSVARMLELMTQQRAAVTRGWRAVAVAVTAALPVLLTLFGAILVTTAVERLSELPAELRIVAGGLEQLRRADTRTIILSADDRQAIELLLATRYRSALQDAIAFRGLDPVMASVFSQRDRRIAADLLRRYPPAPGPSTVDPALIARLQRWPPNDVPSTFVVIVTMLFTTLAAIAVFSLLCALAFRGGLMRLLQMEIVNRRGEPASRLRVFARQTVTWSPLLVPLFALAGLGRSGTTLFALCGVAAALVAAGAAAAVANPHRGVQDRLAGTWIVPR